MPEERKEREKNTIRKDNSSLEIIYNLITLITIKRHEENNEETED